MKKNLVYYCYFKNSEISEYTRYNLDILSIYMHLFDGQKIIKIAVDDLNVDNSHLVNLFKGCETELVLNNSETRESEYFIESLKEIKDVDSITFYSHNKGGTKDDYHDDTIKYWMFSMYFFNLNIPYVEMVENCLINDKIFSGVLRKEIDCSPWVTSPWCYTGTFFWFNTKKLFSIQNWDNIIKGRFSVERYPGSVTGLENSNCTFFTEARNYNTYAFSFWKELITPKNLEENYTSFVNLYNKIFK